ncbi:methionine--tRNA ligase [Patescibacteria group bacterium]|nr:methionine--tRNA ligase [Patescibacteria group bacterium]
MKSSYYITTTLPYVNADPHIGFALEIIQADVLARYHRLLGEEVVFNTGTDEHGAKIYEQATARGVSPQAYCDEYAPKFHALREALNVSYTNFIRTTDANHVTAAQEFWNRCAANGDIYKKNYRTKYCVGCELEKTDSELVNDRCPIHPNREIEIREEENYFFRWSRYQEPLLAFYDAHPDFVVPEGRYNETRSLVRAGLQDFSVSRLASKMPWGIPVPGDDAHVMYVWFDALVNYIATLGWPTDEKQFTQFWPGVQVAGKDNLKQQTAMWQGMLLSAQLPLSKQVFLHGHITAEGQKMSKSLGNVVNPNDLVATYGTDAVRAYLLGSMPSQNDGDFSQRSFSESYTTRLANGIGNLAARTGTMVEKYCEGKAPAIAADIFDTTTFWKTYDDALAAYRFDDAMHAVDQLVTACNKAIDEQAPWKAAKEGKDVAPFLGQLTEALRHVALALLPLLPKTAEQMLGQLSIDATTIGFPGARTWGLLAAGTPVRKGDILFPRKETV